MIIDPYKYASTAVSGNPGSIELDGINQYVRSDLNVNNYVTNTNNCTYSCWVKSLSAVTSTKWIFGWYRTGVEYCYVRVIAGNTLYVNIRGTGLTWGASATPTVDFDDGLWHHIALVLDNGGSTIKLYCDGVVVASTSNTVAFTQWKPLDIAALWGTSWINNIRVCQMAVYDTPLNSTDIADIYNSGVLADITTLSSYTDCVLHWRMDQDEVLPVIADQSGNGHDGTAYNSPTLSSDYPS